MKIDIALGKAKAKDEQYKELLDYFEQLQKPNIFDPFDDYNILRKLDSEFEESANVMEDEGAFDPKNLSEYSYFHKIIHLNKKFKPNAAQ
jgi:hypothetical protein